MSEPAEQPKHDRSLLKFYFVLGTILLLLTLYVGTYLLRSVGGIYEPEIIGTGGVKSYVWVPRGFAREDAWNTTLMYFYYPLFYFDVRYLHNSDNVYSNKYPVNRDWPRKKQEPSK